MPGADILPFPQPVANAAMLMLDLPHGDAMSVAELQLGNRLHQQLDIHPLLEQFLQETRGSLPIESLCYTIPDGGEMFLAGSGRGRTSACWRVNFGGEFLGQIEVELSAELKLPLPQLLAPLAAPLRNALCHHRLKLLSRKDPLTTLGNRMALESALATEAAKAQRFGHAFALLVVDIDNFKQVNDSLGHSAGDKVIRTVAAQIQDCLRPYDQAFRFGGEEFVVLLSQTGIGKARQIAERIRRRIAVQCKVNAEPVRKITVSIGGGEFRSNESVEDLFNRADEALYAAKNQGRNRVIATA